MKKKDFDNPDYILDEEYLQGMNIDNFKSVQNLDARKSRLVKEVLVGCVKFPMSSGSLFKIFPNLGGLLIENLDFHEVPMLKSMQDLSIREGKISPKLLLKMPNLKEFSMHWTQENKLQEIEGAQKYLPPNCKLFKEEKTSIRYEPLHHGIFRKKKESFDYYSSSDSVSDEENSSEENSSEENSPEENSSDENSEENQLQ